MIKINNNDFTLLINILSSSKVVIDVFCNNNLYRVIYNHDHIEMIERIINGHLLKVEDFNEIEDYDRIFEIVKAKVEQMDLRRVVH